MSVITVTNTNFEAEVLKSDKPVLVDFWASWCGPCRMLSPIVDQLADERDDVKFCKINVDENTPLAVKYGISSIPALLLFKNGTPVRTAVGARPKSQVEEFLK